MHIPEEARKKPQEPEENEDKKETKEEFNFRLYFPVDASGKEVVCS